MNKVLVVLAHPNFDISVANKALLDGVKESVTIHNIYEAYPDGKIDVEKEQQILSEYDKIILQFPTFWFNVPAFLKQWFDEVLTYGWAYGPEGEAFVNKKIGIATTTGGLQEVYKHEGLRGFTVEEFLLPVIGSIQYINAEYIGYVVLNNGFAPTSEEVSKSQEEYLQLLSK